ncbi:MAG: EamA family transporter [Melioribacteraceae bacterium]|nr:EamA family transporter [Melioribacteraceae bacterium]
MKNLLLFTITVLIWGSTWLIITFQLGVVEPIISVVYRYLLASAILLLYCLISGKNLKYSLKEHYFMLQLGILLFGFNYWFTYTAELYIASGLVAVAFSTIVFFNIFNNAIFLRTRINKNVLISAIIGFIGILLVFKDEIFNFNLDSNNTKGFIFAMSGAFIASLGNITSARNQKNKLPVIQTNAYAMLYGAIIMFIVAILSNAPINFEFTLSYVSALLYLSIFGSIIAFSAYLTLLGNVGPDRAGYVTLVFPIIALLLSAIFENYIISPLAILGISLITIGNVIVLRK